MKEGRKEGMYEWHAMSCHAMPCHAIPSIPFHSLPSHPIPFHPIPSHPSIHPSIHRSIPPFIHSSSRPIHLFIHCLPRFVHSLNLQAGHAQDQAGQRAEQAHRGLQKALTELGVQGLGVGGNVGLKV